MAEGFNLNDRLTAYEELVEYKSVPEYITSNLAFELREYQAKALQRYLYYSCDECKLKVGGVPQKKSAHLLWQMATGSGKTLIMAAIILEMYKRGYRNFWYFVPDTDLVTKTIENFVNAQSKKYQFAKKIEIDGRVVEVKQVDNFTGVNEGDINIKFSTINSLHNIANPLLIKENQITTEDFKEQELVLIADEAHHLNASTKSDKEKGKGKGKGKDKGRGKNKDEDEEKDAESSWEDSVQKFLEINENNRLFEFTATAGLNDKVIAQKYSDKLIYNYDLKEFCKAGFSKEVLTFATDTENLEQVQFRAILISEYRKNIAADNGIFLKPVILFKSRITAESKKNFDAFNDFIKNLSAKRIKAEFESGGKAAGSDTNDIWEKTKRYFLQDLQKLNSLAEEIKSDFDEQKRQVLLHDGTNTRAPDQPHLLATLEEGNNPVRAVFTVKMLQEGWDVLNLFDIVRLYNTRDGEWKGAEYKAGSTTISEQQLIGRGARYFPFELGDKDKYKRKFDGDLSNPLRAIEQLHYHCQNNPEYIRELNKALTQSGIIDDNKITYTVKQKELFINDNTFQEKKVYENKKISKKERFKLEEQGSLFSEEELTECENASGESGESNEVLEIALSLGGAAESKILDEREIKSPSEAKITQFKIKELIPKNILRRALDGNKNFTFEKIKEAYPEKKSLDDYLETLLEKTINVPLSGNLTCDMALEIAKKFLYQEKITVKKEAEKEFVVKKFEPKPVKEKFAKEITWKSEKELEELDSEIAKAAWFVYDKNYGTKDENSFLKWFSKEMMTPDKDNKTALQKNGWSKIHLARNDEKSAHPVKLYSWLKGSAGKGFEPDFVLFMTKKSEEYVFYIEAKGDWAYNEQKKDFGKEQWKEEFLLALEAAANEQVKKESEKFHIIGFHLYDDKHTKDKFIKDFEEKTKGEP